MIHAICDFCGEDCDRTATFLTLTPFQNFARYHTDNDPAATVGRTKSFTICAECSEKHGLPNPYESYSEPEWQQKASYKKWIDNCADSLEKVEEKLVGE